MQYKFNFFITKLGDWWDHDFCLVSGAEKWCGKQPTCGDEMNNLLGLNSPIRAENPLRGMRMHFLLRSQA